MAMMSLSKASLQSWWFWCPEDLATQLLNGQNDLELEALIQVKSLRHSFLTLTREQHIFSFMGQTVHI